MEKFIYSLGLVFSGLILGLFLKALIDKKWLNLPFNLLFIRKLLQKIALLFFNPIAFTGAIWIVNLDNLKYIALPFIGFSALFTGGLLAYLFARTLHFNRKQTGTYIVSGAFTNIGSIGGLLCFIFLGESGFALMPFYKLLEEFSYFGFGFPLAKSYSEDITKAESFLGRIRKVFSDPFVLVALAAILAGFSLNISRIPRPHFYQIINKIFIPTSTILLLSSIGMGMQFKGLSRYFKVSSYIALIKFLIIPVCITGIAWLMGFGQIQNGLPLKVVLILSSMPVGFIAMVPPTIYDLDVDLANSNWLVTNILLIVIIPLLYFLTAWM